MRNTDHFHLEPMRCAHIGKVTRKMCVCARTGWCGVYNCTCMTQTNTNALYRGAILFLPLCVCFSCLCLCVCVYACVERRPLSEKPPLTDVPVARGNSPWRMEVGTPHNTRFDRAGSGRFQGNIKLQRKGRSTLSGVCGGRGGVVAGALLFYVFQRL